MRIAQAYRYVLCSLAGLSAAVQAVPPEDVLRTLPVKRTQQGPAALLNVWPGTEGATAGGFPASGVSMLSRVSVSELTNGGGASAANDVWGFVSDLGREYAIVGLNVGTAFVDITDPANPVVVATLVDASSIWSDMKHYQGYVYNVNESGGGMQVINVQQIDAGIVSFAPPLTDSGLQTAHNVALDADSGYAYLCGSNISSGLVAVDVSIPRSPTVAGVWSGPSVHDAQIVTYQDGPYAGREIAFCFCGSAGLYIADVTDKGNMFTLSSLAYPNLTFSHQGWASEDRRYVFIGDELDELQNPSVSSTTMYIIDIQDLENPQFVTSFTNGSNSIDHNLMTRGHYVFAANYTSGLRVFDVADVNNIQEVGYFDTYPSSNSRSFNGAWGSFSDFPSRVVLVSDQSSGLFVLDASAVLDEACLNPAAPQPESPVIVKNRYISVQPGNAGRQTALSVTLTDLPTGYELFEGTQMWVDEPTLKTTATGSYHVSAVRCDPLYRDWGDVDVVHLFGRAVIPAGTYDIQTFEETCGAGVQMRSSVSNAFLTASPWGDIWGPNGAGPDGDANFTDISGVVDAFRGIAAAAPMPQADLAPDAADQIVDFSDIGSAVDAFRLLPHGLAGPAGCP